MRILSYFKQKFYEGRKRKAKLSFPVFCKLHGVAQPYYQGAIAQSSAGDELQIVHRPTAERPYCVCVYSIEIHRILGYLDERLSQKLVYLFGKDFCRDAEVANVTGGPPEYSYFGCNIRIAETQNMMRPYLKDLPYLIGQG